MARPEDYPCTFEGLCEYLEGCGVGRHFRELNLIHHKNRTWTGASYIVPPQSDWPNILPTMRLADYLREAWDAPLRILSGYRCPEYNALVGSKSTNHVRFGALDLQARWGGRILFARLTRRIVQVARDHGEYVGLGLYPSFVHIDVGLYARQRNWGSMIAAEVGP